MARLSKIGLYFHTLRHLRLVQVATRIKKHFRTQKYYSSNEAAPPLRNRNPKDLEWIERPASMTGPNAFRFLNHNGILDTAADWNSKEQSKLWLYNLHYFDYLQAAPCSENNHWCGTIINRWIAENPPGFGNGWEPYPLSLRIVNWIKWHLAGSPLQQDQLNSLASQIRSLARNIEWHLLGNHLFANAKALFFAGMFFDGPEAHAWLQQAEAILRNELSEQILEDGGHFERSPMYHATLLEDMLDLINLKKTYADQPNAITTDELSDLAVKMLDWLRCMTHPDGQVSFFNDAAFEIAPTLSQLQSCAHRLGLEFEEDPPLGLHHLASSGYARLGDGDASMIVDIAPVGPDYIPGHAHADTLAMEFCLGAERVIVNCGTSTYASGSVREFERSTAAHSTVQIDGENSSEVWAGFRVARRARPFSVEAIATKNKFTIAASHDGYRRLTGRNIHRRTWELQNQCLCVTDDVQGSYSSAVARFHFAPGVICTLSNDGQSGAATTTAGRKLYWQTETPGRIEDSKWSPRFGVTMATHCLVVPVFQGQLKTQLRW